MGSRFLYFARLINKVKIDFHVDMRSSSHRSRKQPLGPSLVTPFNKCKESKDDVLRDIPESEVQSYADRTLLHQLCKGGGAPGVVILTSYLQILFNGAPQACGGIAHLQSSGLPTL